jgi:hypothetical protein
LKLSLFQVTRRQAFTLRPERSVEGRLVSQAMKAWLRIGKQKDVILHSISSFFFHLPDKESFSAYSFLHH